MTRRLAVLAVLIAVLLALGVGAVLAAPQRDGGNAGGHDRMHASEDMRAMHEQMPDEAQADCDRMHGRMEAMHGRGGHMSGHEAMMNRATPVTPPNSP